MAARYGWKIGDKIPIEGTIWQPKQGSTWFFNIVGIYDGDDDRRQDAISSSATTTSTRTAAAAYGQVGWYIIKIDDPSQAADHGGEARLAIRELFRRDEDLDREGLSRRDS